MFRSWFLLTSENEKLSPCNFLLECKWTMHDHGIFCAQMKLISISKVLSILKISEYGQERIRSKCNHCLFILKRSLWCGFTAAFIVGPSFVEEIGPSGPVTVQSMEHVRNQLIRALQQRGCVDSTIFMQDGSPPHIATPVKQLLNLHFGNDRIISRHFPTAWPPRSPDLNPCAFWMWNYKMLCTGGPFANLAVLKNRITQHIHNITTETLRSVVEHAVLRFQLIEENSGQHIEYFLSKSKPTSFSLWFHQFLLYLRFMA
ncbi:hypothetical protein AVEN_181596-1 [Araneus ventricosus]|uniref:Tc1-like transposase DDE domain-containing protein n=1 Tax=Araneus ventricosus TaxID=182803 RepID=A0A4Y2MN12_ARAVE|nr:hypothetical protein AVEN_181596-1 [Araneus ventricosus]